MATKIPVKSILKQQIPKPSPADEAQAKANRDRQNYNLALQHAYRIQDRKDWELRILNALQILIEYPVASQHTPEEAIKYLQLIQPFQPSDLDALVEERCIDRKCGYALCLKTPRTLSVGKDAEWKFGKYAQNFCSGLCAKKCAYLKTQLSEVPVWERDPSIAVQIQLPEQDRPTDLPAKPARAEVSVDGVAADIQELALERGEKAASFRPRQVMTDRIVEKAHFEHKPIAGIETAAVSSTAIEGYEPRVKTRVGFVEEKDGDSEEDDEEAGE